MNPIMSILKKQSSPASPLSKSANTNLQQIVNDFKAGKLDAKQTALGFIKNMSPQQKSAIRQMLPQLKLLGKTFGASDNSINVFTTELQDQLR